MLTFKQFLIMEGGAATAGWNTSRAGAEDISRAMKFVAATLKIPEKTLRGDLLGGTEATLLGFKPHSGDVDIAISLEDHSPEDVVAAMMSATGNMGVWNAGTRVGSFAVPVGDDRRVQVDLMFVKNKDWARFAYYSGVGRGSKYPGAVRNILLVTALSHTHEPGKDFVLRDDEGTVIARASRSIKFDSGMERLFKATKINTKTGRRGKTASPVSPSEIKKILTDLGKEIQFSEKSEHTDNPDEVAAFIFGRGVAAADVMTAEQVIELIHQHPRGNEIVAAAKKQLSDLNLPIPEEL